jgi:hypothetical protein
MYNVFHDSIVSRSPIEIFILIATLALALFYMSRRNGKR